MNKVFFRKYLKYCDKNTNKTSSKIYQRKFELTSQLPFTVQQQTIESKERNS